jgi:hypothetical protein
MRHVAGCSVALVFHKARRFLLFVVELSDAGKHLCRLCLGFLLLVLPVTYIVYYNRLRHSMRLLPGAAVQRETW